MIEFKQVMEHIEVFYNGIFLFSADNMKEAREELYGLSLGSPCCNAAMVSILIPYGKRQAPNAEPDNHFYSCRISSQFRFGILRELKEVIYG